MSDNPFQEELKFSTNNFYLFNAVTNRLKEKALTGKTTKAIELYSKLASQGMEITEALKKGLKILGYQFRKDTSSKIKKTVSDYNPNEWLYKENKLVLYDPIENFNEECKSRLTRVEKTKRFWG